MAFSAPPRVCGSSRGISEAEVLEQGRRLPWLPYFRSALAFSTRHLPCGLPWRIFLCALLRMVVSARVGYQRGYPLEVCTCPSIIVPSAAPECGSMGGSAAEAMQSTRIRILYTSNQGGIPPDVAALGSLNDAPPQTFSTNLHYYQHHTNAYTLSHKNPEYALGLQPKLFFHPGVFVVYEDGIQQSACYKTHPPLAGVTVCRSRRPSRRQYDMPKVQIPGNPFYLDGRKAKKKRRVKIANPKQAKMVIRRADRDEARKLAISNEKKKIRKLKPGSTQQKKFDLLHSSAQSGSQFDNNDASRPSKQTRQIKRSLRSGVAANLRSKTDSIVKKKKAKRKISASKKALVAKIKARDLARKAKKKK